ncbi:MAG: KH domain-containing protein [Chloroflexi bacterium]|nr:KH domain-containing protein [Chloroflexota bacterium]
MLTLLGLMDTQIEARDPETPGDGVGRTAQVFEIFGETEDASDELGLLIGRRGETLGALQYLLNVVTRHHYGEANHVFSVDVEGYKRRRERSLVEMARRVAAEVRDTGDVITLEPMKPAERRIVHLTLSDEPGVTTESVGSGNERQVEVLPTDYDDYGDDYDDYDEGGEYAGDEPVAEHDEDDVESVEEYDGEDNEAAAGPVDDEADEDEAGPVEDYAGEDDEDDAGPVDDYDDEDDEDDEGPNR